jgi:hypothetical protein
MVWMLKMLGLEMEPEEVAGVPPPPKEESGRRKEEEKL